MKRCHCQVKHANQVSVLMLTLHKQQCVVACIQLNMQRCSLCRKATPTLAATASATPSSR